MATGYIELPSDCGACGHIDLSSVSLNGPKGGAVSPVTDPKYGFVTSPSGYCVDNDGDGALERLVEFLREHVVGIVQEPSSVPTISGKLHASSKYGAASFVGSDEIRVKAGKQTAEDDGGKGKGKGLAKPVAGITGADLSVFEGSPAARLGVDASENLAFQLHQTYPNPFNPYTIIRYTLPGDSAVRLVTYGVLGQQVRVLVDGTQAAGGYAVRQDGRDGFGRAASGGVYLYRLEAGKSVAVKKMVLVKQFTASNLSV